MGRAEGAEKAKEGDASATVEGNKDGVKDGVSSKDGTEELVDDKEEDYLHGAPGGQAVS